LFKNITLFFTNKDKLQMPMQHKHSLRCYELPPIPSC